MKSIILFVVSFCALTASQSYAQSSTKPDGGIIAAKNVVLYNGENSILYYYRSYDKADWKYMQISPQKGQERTLRCPRCGDDCYKPIFIKEPDDACPATFYTLEGGKAYTLGKNSEGCLTVTNHRP